MKTRIFTLLAFSAMLIFAACDKDDVEPIVDPTDTVVTPVVDPIADYIGTYDMVGIYDSIGVDGTWFENGFAGQNYDPDSGYLVISRIDDDANSIKLEGYVVLSDANGQPVEYKFYDTQATLNSDSLFVPEASRFTMNDYLFSMTYGPMHLDNDFLTFRIEQHVPLMGMDCGYIIIANCTKRTE